MVEVFKTNITNKQIADEIIEQFQLLFPHFKINFDLSDCDNILRVESENNETEVIAQKIISLGYNCEPLE